MGPGLMPLTTDVVMVGRAFPVSVEPADGPGHPPYRGLLRALDALGRDDVYVVTPGVRRDVALWGELLATAALARGAAGALCDGFVRDLAQLRKLALPVVARGTAPHDIDGRLEVVGFGDPVEIGGVVIAAGELIVGDLDGVVVIPFEAEADIIAMALEKSRAEDGFREAVRAGMAPSSAFEQHRVL